MKKDRFNTLWRIAFLLIMLTSLTSAKIASDSVVNNSSDGKTLKIAEKLVYVFEIRREIAKPVWRITQEAFREAMALKADYIIIHLNTYGGMVNIADSIRTKMLNSTIPVIVFIDNQAISAGALISIAADSIYMRSGGSIGAATVVDQSGAVVPDKYQSFMRSTMRATAEAHGKDTVITGKDTTYVWHRDPHIAEAMVDPNVKVAGLIDSGKVLTLTVEEAILVGYCEGKANNLREVLEKSGLSDYEVKHYEMKAIDKIIVFLLSPVVQSILILLIIGGIYFELQAPGIGLALGLSIVGALLYFAPLYIQGLAENWEILAFIAGVILLAVEIFVIPGFGVAGIAGIILMLLGLTLGVIDNIVFEYKGLGAMGLVVRIFGRIMLVVILAFILSIWLSRKIGTSGFLKGIALDAQQESSEGFIGIDTRQKLMIGKTGIAFTVLRPSGRIQIDEEIFDAMAEVGYINKGDAVKVIRDEAGQLYVIKI